VLLIDERELTVGTLDMIGQDLGVKDSSLYDSEYVDRVVDKCSIGDYSIEEIKQVLKIIDMLNEIKN